MLPNQETNTINKNDFEHDAVNVDHSDVGINNNQGGYDNSPFHTGYPSGSNAYATGTTGTYPTAPMAQEDFKDAQERAKYLSYKASNFIQAHGGIHLMIFLMSLLLLVKAASDIRQNHISKTNNEAEGFAVFLGLISMVLITAHFMAHRKPGMMDDKLRLLVLVVMFILWVVGVGVLTFGSTYNFTGNGYFSTWFGFIFVCQLVMAEIQQADLFVQRFKVFGWQLGTLLVASIVLFFAAISPCKYVCDGATKFILVMAVISAVFCVLIFLFLTNLAPRMRMITLGVLAIFWGLIAFIGTFIEPFQATGNGYFACWVGFISAGLLFHHNAYAGVMNDAPGQTNVV